MAAARDNVLSGSAGPVVRVELLDTPAQIDSLHEIWDQLLTTSATRSYFLRWRWATLWLDFYAPPGSRPYVLVCRDAAGAVIALAPFYLRPRRFAGVTIIRELNFIGTGVDLRSSEHLDVLAAPGAEQEAGAAIGQFLLARRDWDRIWLWSVPSRSLVLPHLQNVLSASVRPCDRVHVLDTAQSWAALRSQWSKSFRSNIERAQRTLTKAHAVQFSRVTTVTALVPALDDFVRLHQLRWQSKGQAGSFTLPKFEEFLRTAVLQAFDAQQLRFWVYRLDGKAVAVLVAFIEGGVAHYFQGGFDPAYAKHSLGSVMVARCIEDCAGDAAIREFDFMGGGSPYKDRWTDTTRTSMELEYLRPGWRSGVYRLARRGVQILRRAVRAVRGAPDRRVAGRPMVMAVAMQVLTCL